MRVIAQANQFFLLASLIPVSLFTMPLYATEFTYQLVDYPGSSRTQLYGTNSASTYVGTTTDPVTNRRMALVDQNGVLSTFEAPGASLTYAVGVDNSGQILGRYNDSNGISHGFLNSAGAFTSFDVPGSTATVPYSLNDAGIIVGSYTDSANRTHAFLYQNGAAATVDDPNGKPTSVLFGINNAGVSVGYFYDSVSDTTQGFIRQANGTLQNLDYSSSNESYPIGINNAGQIVGVYFDEQDNGFGYFRDADGAFFTLNALAGGTTVPFGIDGSGNVVGYVTDGAARHGFIATPVPEPAALAPFGLVLLSGGWLIARRRRTCSAGS